MPVIAHLSDTHLDGGDGPPLARLRAVVSALRTLSVDAVLVTGDLADRGAVAEYEQFAAELSVLQVPVLALPGNHDDRAAFRAVLAAGAGAGTGAGDPGSAAAVTSTHLVGDVLVALCDSVVPGRSEGRLGPGTLAWLDGALAAHRGPALVCLHHPPVRTGLPIMDEILLTDPDELAAVVTAHPHVVAVLAGHAHLSLTTTFAGRPLVVAPAVVSTLRLPWQEPLPADWDDAVEPAATPPQFALHHVDGRGRLTSIVRAVPWAG